MTKKHAKLPSMQRVNNFIIVFVSQEVEMAHQPMMYGDGMVMEPEPRTGLQKVSLFLTPSNRFSV